MYFSIALTEEIVVVSCSFIFYNPLDKVNKLLVAGLGNLFSPLLVFFATPLQVFFACIPRFCRCWCSSQPCRFYGQKICNRLLDQLLNDRDKDLDQLPVLQHCLMRTYKFFLDNPTGNEIEFEHYEAAGKLEHALSDHANEIYEKLNDKQKKIAAIIFKSLTDENAENEPIRRRQSFYEINELCKSLPSVQRMM
ncbi:MAG: hypothetical protein ACR2KZ_06865 [Segetibacter sp.]